MRNLIVVLSGGMSNEREISFLTGKACANALEKKGCAAKSITIKENNAIFVELISLNYR